MSRILSPFTLVLSAITLILQFFTFAAAQDIEAVINVAAGPADRVDVRIDAPSGKLPEKIRFLENYGPERSLGNRIRNIRYYHGVAEVDARSVAAQSISRIEYSVDLSPRPGLFAAAHTSWRTSDGALLMLDDLLPQAMPAARVAVNPPPGWAVAANSRQYAQNVFQIADPERAVIFLGSQIRERPAGRSRLLISGEWLFSDEEASAMAESLLKEFEGLFGKLSGDVVIRIAKFPTSQTHGQWEADTRGRTLTIISSDMPFKNQSIQRLHEQLRHELIHLWVPNELKLSGTYDWFYEGFAMYQSLKTGVAVGQLRFEDMLATLSQAFAIDSSGNGSLLEASRDRWAGSGSRVYARGLAVAFLADVAMIDASKGKRSSTTLLGELLDRHRAGDSKQDGSSAVIALMRSRPELVPIIEKYVTGAEAAKNSDLIATAGLGNSVGNSLVLLPKPTGRQREVLKRLGIDAWRTKAGRN